MHELLGCHSLNSELFETSYMPIGIFIQQIMSAKPGVFVSHEQFSLWSMLEWPHHHRLTFPYIQYLAVPNWAPSNLRHF